MIAVVFVLINKMMTESKSPRFEVNEFYQYNKFISQENLFSTFEDEDAEVFRC